MATVRSTWTGVPVPIDGMLWRSRSNIAYLSALHWSGQAPQIFCLRQ